MTFEEYMAKSKRALESARLLMEDGDTNGSCNRAYYAMFNAACAALAASQALADPSTVKTHSGLITAFGEHLVKPGILPVALGQSLNQVERIRLLADYTDKEVNPADASWVIEQAVTMTAAVESRLRR